MANTTGYAKDNRSSPPPSSPAAPEAPTTTVLATIDRPADLRGLDRDQLDRLAAEIRTVLVRTVSRTGGHLGPNLGVVELTLALHRVFESPRDTIIWDTGHQSYVHKLVTGRYRDFERLRQRGGLSGYPSRTESRHDVVENSHASTALAWADGIAKAYQLRGATGRHVVAVIGDGAMTGGQAWEGLNNISAGRDRPVIVVLNDNQRSYAPTIGGLADHLTALRADPDSRRNLFECLGLHYIGPVDGHDTEAVEHALRQAARLRGAAVVHCVTRKGHGHPAAERHEGDRMHVTRAAKPNGPPVSTGPSWTSAFAEEMVALGGERPDVVAVTAAMLEPVGLAPFADTYPDRVFDVGIAEQHAVTSAAGLARGGLHPVVAVYATFLNRAFDQVLMDAALHRCGMTLVLDRAGLTGDDGPSHNGMWDLSMLQLVPGLRIAAPRDATQLRAQLREAVRIDDAPTVLRFPKGPANPDVVAVDRIGGVDILRQPIGQDGAARSTPVLVVSVGSMAATCLALAERLAEHGIPVTVVDPRWVKPVDPALITLAERHGLVVTVEDNGRVGGVGSVLAQALRNAAVPTPLRDFGVPQRFVTHGTRQQSLLDAGLTAPDLTTEILALLDALAGSPAQQRPAPTEGSLT
ncbi:MAG TPA: 1-deoxy-D-xylulose-5-phosphate synthase [Pseudonocardiaceae bacterium]